MVASGARCVIGVDGGGTATRVLLADGEGRDLLRRSGPPALVDPRDPQASAATVIRLVRDVAAAAETRLPVAALCAGLAGAGAPDSRARVRDELASAGVAHRIAVVPDGETALEGALAGSPGVLLVAGTGSGAWGRAEDGRVARCGGWGMDAGDEGSGYALGRGALRAAVQAADGRGGPTALLPEVLAGLGLAAPEEIPGWARQAGKAEEGDGVAEAIVDTAAAELARHVEALVERLGPWEKPVAVVFHGGVLRESAMADRVERRLHAAPPPTVRQAAAGDALTGAVRLALALG